MEQSFQLWLSPYVTWRSRVPATGSHSQLHARAVTLTASGLPSQVPGPREADLVMRQEFPAVRGLGENWVWPVGGGTEPGSWGWAPPSLQVPQVSEVGWRPSWAVSGSGHMPTSCPCGPERSPWGGILATRGGGRTLAPAPVMGGSTEPSHGSAIPQPPPTEPQEDVRGTG